MQKIIKLSILVFSIAEIKAQTDSVKPFEQVINSNISIRMVPISAGNYLMGSPLTEKGRQKDEGPQIMIKVEPFWMAATEITHDQFAAFRFEEKDMNPKPDAISRPTAQYIDLTWGMGKEGGFPANSMQPYTAITFCKWLWKKTGVFYRLPTEAEWEYAAKAGKNGQFQDGVTAQNIKNYSWYVANSADKYHEVGKKLPNKWGLYDMMGNVAEWTMDMYKEDYYKILKDSPTSTFFVKRSNYRSYHTTKGGGFKSSITELRPADRNPQTENWNRRDPQIPRSKWWMTDGDYVGFRIVKPFFQPTKEEIEKFFDDALSEE